MSIEYLNAAFESPLMGAKKSVLISISDRANNAGYCYPSLSDIAKRSGCSKRTAINAVSELEKLCFLIVIRDHGKLNKYIISPENLSTSDEAVSLDKVIHNGEAISPTSEINDKNQCNHFTQTIRTTTNQKEGDLFKPENQNQKNRRPRINSAAYKIYKPETQTVAENEMSHIKNLLGRS